MIGTVYLVPSFLFENAAETIPAYVVDTVKICHVFFVENERSARRYLKVIWKDIIIDDQLWYTIHKAEDAVQHTFKELLLKGNNIAIISEAGCPGVADPGQKLVSVAQGCGATVKPLVGPSSILLALMASGMNGQKFQFWGYLPIDGAERKNTLKEMEIESARKNCTQIFIETPFRNNQMIRQVLETCRPQTRFCIAVDLTGPTEQIITKTVGDWKKQVPDIHKRPCIFLLHSPD